VKDAPSLPPGFDYRPGWLSSDRAAELLRQLRAEVAWGQPEIVMFGRSVAQPRLVAWQADPGVAYRYSGLTLEATPWHPQVDALRDRLSKSLETRFNSVLLNAYRSGADSMGWHADDEPELGPEPLIASVSLGETRRMRVKPAAGGSSVGWDLHSGSLLVMSGRSQADYRHAIPKTRRPVGLRINLTFRKIH
jgi:alkylated DNA repair dioxygenase AlkB